MNREPVPTYAVVALFRQLARNADALADDLEQDTASVFTDEHAAAYAVRVNDVNAAHDVAVRRLVMHLRDNGVPWQAVGTVLGMSRQSAHQRYGRYDRDAEPTLIDDNDWDDTYLGPA